MVQRVTDNQVDPRAFTGARLQAADFGSGRAIAAGAQDLGQGLNTATANLAKIGEMHDDAVVKQADTEDLREIMQLRAEALSSTGLEAQPAIDAAAKRIDEIKRTRLAALSNSRQRQMYSDVFDARSLQIQEQFATHGIKQIKEAEKTAAVERSSAYSDLAVDTYGTDAFESNLQTVRSEIATVNRGMPAEVIARRQAEATSKVYARVISGMLTNPENVQEANLALEQHADQILPDEELVLRKQLNPLLEEDQTEVDAGRAFSASPVPSEQGDGVPDTQAAAPQKSYYPNDNAPGKGWLPVKGGKITETAAGHRARGSGNALDIAAPEGTPIYAPMSGKVIKSFWTERGGWQVLVEHPNGYVTGYAHMRSKSPLEEGEQIESTTALGSVGSTGHSTGPHVHYTVRQSRGGPKVDPDVAWNGQVKPDSVSWKEGSLTKYTADENGLTRALDRLHSIATAENWSQRRYQRAVDRARQIAGVQNQMYDQQQYERTENAMDVVANLGDKLTSVSQIPGFSTLKPGQRIAIQNIIKSNKGGGDGEGGSDSYFRYFDQAMNPATRDEFSKNSDIMLDPNLTRGERKQLRNMQWSIRNDQDGKLQSSMDEGFSMMNRFMPKKVFPDEAKRQLFVNRYMQRVTEEQQKSGRVLSGEEKLNIARSMVTPIVLYEDGKKVGKTTLLDYQGPGKQRATVNYEEVFKTIPQTFVEQTVRSLAAAGQNHSKQDVVRVWLENGR